MSIVSNLGAFGALRTITRLLGTEERKRRFQNEIMAQIGMGTGQRGTTTPLLTAGPMSSLEQQQGGSAWQPPVASTRRELGPAPQYASPQQGTLSGLSGGQKASSIFRGMLGGRGFMNEIERNAAEIRDAQRRERLDAVYRERLSDPNLSDRERLEFETMLAQPEGGQPRYIPGQTRRLFGMDVPTGAHERQRYYYAGTEAPLQPPGTEGSPYQPVGEAYDTRYYTGLDRAEDARERAGMRRWWNSLSRSEQMLETMMNPAVRMKIMAPIPGESREDYLNFIDTLSGGKTRGPTKPPSRPSGMTPDQQSLWDVLSERYGVE